jgi:hypothetical protein
MNKENYINAINEFNSIKSFNMLLPTKEAYYEKLIPYTDDIVSLTQELTNLEKNRKCGLFNIKHSNEICLFVVHINQVSNGIREYMDIEYEY